MYMPGVRPQVASDLRRRSESSLPSWACVLFGGFAIEFLQSGFSGTLRYATTLNERWLKTAMFVQ
jgi:hypothetical protein